MAENTTITMPARHRHRLIKLGLVLLLFAIAQAALAAWTEPIAPPTEGNVSAPLNVSDVEQTKLGKLNLAGGLHVENFNGLHAFEATAPAAAGFEPSSGIFGLGGEAVYNTNMSAGVHGVSTATITGLGRHVGVLGVASVNNANYIGLYGWDGVEDPSGTGNAYAGYFSGRVEVNGRLVVNDTIDAADATNNLFITGGVDVLNNARYRNVAIGVEALKSITDDDNNVAIGYQAGDSQQGVNENVYIGTYAGQRNVAGNRNTLVGNATGADSSGYALIGIGDSAARYSTGNENILIGIRAGARLPSGVVPSGSRNIAIGKEAGTGLVGDDNVVIGINAGKTLNAATSNSNVFIGPSAGMSATGPNNVAIGFRAGTNITGSENLILGMDAGTAVTSGQRNIIIGYGANVANGTINDSIAIGRDATATAGQQFVIGSASAPIDSIFLGEGVTSATPIAVGINATGGQGVDIAGGNLVLNGGRGTGSAPGGNLVFQTPFPGATGIQIQPLIERMRITETGRVGIGTATPSARLHIEGGNLLATGTAGATPVSGAGTRLMWIPEKAAFRAGQVQGTQWDDANIGGRSFAAGINTLASGWASVALGRETTATNEASIALGLGATSSGLSALAVGVSTASGNNSAAIGRGATASGDDAIALGPTSRAEGANTVAIGSGARATGTNSIALGSGSDTNVGAANSVLVNLDPVVGYTLNVSRVFAITGGQVSIGGGSPHASSIFSVDSNNRGVSLPQLTTTERDAIASPRPGLLLYNRVASEFQYYRNNAWVPVGGDTDWVVNGNIMYSGVSGNVGIGTNAPAQPFHVNGTAIVLSSQDVRGDIFLNGGTDSKATIINYGALSGGIDFAYSNSGAPNYSGSLASLLTILNGGTVGIGITNPAAKLTVSNRGSSATPGSAGDAIYAEANSINAAISANQVDIAGYAGYFSGRGIFTWNKNNSSSNPLLDAAFVAQNTANGSGLVAAYFENNAGAQDARATIISDNLNSGGYAGWFKGKLKVDEGLDFTNQKVCYCRNDSVKSDTAITISNDWTQAMCTSACSTLYSLGSVASYHCITPAGYSTNSAACGW